MRTDSGKNGLLKRYLTVLCRCYSTGEFEALFPFLAEECVFESQWVLTPHTGKTAVINYFLKKGAALRKNNSCPECSIVEFVGNLNTVKNAEVRLNGGEKHRASVGLWYPAGKLAMFMRQTLNGETSGVIADLRLNGENLISRIDLCMPELFRFRFFIDLPEAESEVCALYLNDAEIETALKRILAETDCDYAKLNRFIDEQASRYSGELTEFAFRTAVRSGKTEYVVRHVGEFDLNDGDGGSTYLLEAAGEDIQKILMQYGAFKSLEDFKDCRFAMECVYGEIIAFAPGFQREVYKRYKEVFELTDGRIAEILSNGCYDDISGRDVDDDLTIMGVSENDGNFSFRNMCGYSGYELMELIEDLGWETDFKGDSRDSDSLGVYFIK